MIKDNESLEVKEEAVLSKFEGEPLPENEFERLTIVNGVVERHELIVNGEPVGSVPDSEILGKDIGRLLS